MIKEHSIYEITMADAIDPGRTDPNVPNTQQRVLSYGSKDDIVARTLLTADALTRGRMLADDVPNDQIISLSFRALTHLAAMTDHTRAVGDQINAICATWEGRVEMGMNVPSVKELDSHVRASITGADHAFQQLLSVAAFYLVRLPENSGSSHWRKNLSTALERPIRLPLSFEINCRQSNSSVLQETALSIHAKANT